MTIPKKLKIGAHVYDVKLVKDYFEGENCGIEQRKHKYLAVNSDLAPTHQATSLFHEILHAVNSELDHTLLDSLAEQLYQVLYDNNLLK